MRLIQIKQAIQANPTVKAIFFCSPGNPTGVALRFHDIKEILEFPQYRGVVVVDEAYIDFAVEGKTGESFARHVAQYPNLIVLQTLSKSFGLAGIR